MHLRFYLDTRPKTLLLPFFCIFFSSTSFFNFYLQVFFFYTDFSPSSHFLSFHLIIPLLSSLLSLSYFNTTDFLFVHQFSCLELSTLLHHSLITPYPFPFTSYFTSSYFSSKLFSLRMHPSFRSLLILLHPVYLSSSSSFALLSASSRPSRLAPLSCRSSFPSFITLITLHQPAKSGAKRST